MQFRIKHLVLSIALLAWGCSQPVAQVTTADIRKAFVEHSNSLNELVAMLREDQQVVDIDKHGTILERVSLGRHKQYLKVLREINIPVYTIICDRKEGQLTVNVFVDGWSNKKRLVYTTGVRPKELVMLCMECPTQSFEPLESGWFIGIIDDSTKNSDK